MDERLFALSDKEIEQHEKNYEFLYVDYDEDFNIILTKKFKDYYRPAFLCYKGQYDTLEYMFVVKYVWTAKMADGDVTFIETFESIGETLEELKTSNVFNDIVDKVKNSKDDEDFIDLDTGYYISKDNVLPINTVVYDILGVKYEKVFIK